MSLWYREARRTASEGFSSRSYEQLATDFVVNGMSHPGDLSIGVARNARRPSRNFSLQDRQGRYYILIAVLAIRRDPIAWKPGRHLPSRYFALRMHSLRGMMDQPCGMVGQR